MTTLQTTSREDLARYPIAGAVGLITFRDPGLPLAMPHPDMKVIARLDLVCNDIDEPLPGLVAPDITQAEQIVGFVRATRNADVFLFQCEAGVGRSRGAQIAVAQWCGTDASAALEQGTHNRLVHRLILQALDLVPPREPLVSLAVRVKYPADRLLAFLLCMKRQRHKNWEVVAVSDGPRPDVADMVAGLREPRARLLQTGEAKGRWGHYTRQIGLDACQGEFIGCSNDDNAYSPGYFEQMVFALQHYQADLALCNMSHSYKSYDVITTRPIPNEGDLGCWIARASLVRECPWPGVEFLSDNIHLAQMAAKCGPEKVAYVRRPLFIHN